MSGEPPEGRRLRRRTRTFDSATLPAGLRGRHDTKAGVWAHIVVEAGTLDCELFEPAGRARLRAGETLWLEPRRPHAVTPSADCRFHVEFYD